MATRIKGTSYPRSRTTGGFTGGYYFYRSNSNPNGLTSWNNFSSGDKRVTNDFVTVGFKELSANGAIIMSPYYSTHQVKSTYADSLGSGGIGSGGWWRYEAGPDTQWALGLNASASILGNVPSLHTAQEVNRLATEASTRCLSQIGRASTDSWENMAEIRKTLEMFWNPLRTYWRWWSKGPRRVDLRRPGHVHTVGKQMGIKLHKGLSDSANLWLMYRYGIRPLVSSANDILKALAREVRPDRATTKASVSSSMNSTTTWNYSNSGIFAIRKSITESIHVKAVSVDEVLMDWAYDTGFSVKSLMTLPWELIPYSFVADWFVNTGDLIGALAQAFKEKSLGQCLVTKYIQSAVQCNTSHVASGNYTVTSPLLCGVREDCVTTNRVRGLTTPGLVVKSNFRLDEATRIGDAVALVGQQLLSRNR
jgi:hypothetical protein